MSKRIFFSFTAFLFAVTTCSAAVAADVHAVSKDVSPLAAPVSSDVRPEEKPASDVLKPESFVLQPETKQELSSEEAVRRALRGYDIAVKNDPFGIKPKQVYGPSESVNGSPNQSQNSLRFDRRDNPSFVDSGDFNPYDSDRLSNDARRQISTQRQHTADRIADMISPGFGRAEFDVGDNHVRIDYIYSRRCKTRGIGVCFQMTFR